MLKRFAAFTLEAIGLLTWVFIFIFLSFAFARVSAADEITHPATAEEMTDVMQVAMTKMLETCQELPSQYIGDCMNGVKAGYLLMAEAVYPVKVHDLALFYGAISECANAVVANNNTADTYKPGQVLACAGQSYGLARNFMAARDLEAF